VRTADIADPRHCWPDVRRRDRGGATGAQRAAALPQPPTGRLVVIGAGKASAAMARA